MQDRYVSYFRVSTVRQGQSGLGLEAQRASVAAYVTSTGGSATHEYTEVESGKNSNRPQLAAALKACRESGGTLLIAKLDRLARNVAFIANLLESGVKFVAVDMPSADRFMLHVYAAVAEEEARRISERTRAALAAAKARGVKLGRSSEELSQLNRDTANAFAMKIGPEVHKMIRADGMSYRDAANRLNQVRVKTYRGAQWHAASVNRLFHRYVGLTQTA